MAEVVMGCIASDSPPIRTRTSKWGEAFCALKTDLDPEGRKLQQQVIDQFLSD